MTKRGLSARAVLGPGGDTVSVWGGFAGGRVGGGGGRATRARPSRTRSLRGSVRRPGAWLLGKQFFPRGAAAGTPCAPRAPLAGTAKAGRQAARFLPLGFQAALVGGLHARRPLSYCAPLPHCPAQACRFLAKYQQAIDYDASVIYLVNDFFVSNVGLFFFQVVLTYREV